MFLQERNCKAKVELTAAVQVSATFYIVASGCPFRNERVHRSRKREEYVHDARQHLGKG